MLHPFKRNAFNLLSKEKIFQDLQQVSEIEEKLIPHHPTFEGLDVSIHRIPVDIIGGDCYDIFPLDNNCVMFYMADVAGHGISAGLVSAVMNFLIFTLSKYHTDMIEIMDLANNTLKERTQTEIFITSVMCSWNIKKSTFSYIQAGHQQIIHYKAKTQSVELCSSGGIALGLVENISDFLEKKEVKVEKDDILVIYSDGITETKNTKKECFGIARLMQTIKKNAFCETADEITSLIMSEVHAFRGEGFQEDDVTLMVLKK